MLLHIFGMRFDIIGILVLVSAGMLDHMGDHGHIQIQSVCVVLDNFRQKRTLWQKEGEKMEEKKKKSFFHREN